MRKIMFSKLKALNFFHLFGPTSLKLAVSLMIWAIVLIGVVVYFAKRGENFGEKSENVTVEQESAPGPSAGFQKKAFSTPKPAQGAQTEVSSGFLLEDYLKKDKENVNVAKGTIKFRVKADWIDNESEPEVRRLVLGNFNGEDWRNVFYVAGVSHYIKFETYDYDADKGDVEMMADLGSSYFRKTFDVKIRWDFTRKEPVKQIFVNGKLAVEKTPDKMPSEINKMIFVGPVSNLEIFDGWE